MTKLYSRDHLWVEWEGGGRATVGVSRHAQEELGDILYVELPKPGAALERGKAFGLIESVKTASDLHAPVTGRRGRRTPRSATSRGRSTTRRRTAAGC